MCYPAILTNTLVPEPSLSSTLQNQLGVALESLKISPFLVIDDKHGWGTNVFVRIAG